jgi:hypothetical protein
MADDTQDADGYYGDDDSNVEDLDLSFLDEDESKPDEPAEPTQPAK